MKKEPTQGGFSSTPSLAGVAFFYPPVKGGFRLVPAAGIRLDETRAAALELRL